MKNKQIYGEMTEGLFERLAGASDITITFSRGTDHDLFTNRVELKVLKVNGYSHPKLFRLHVRKLACQVVEGAMKLMATLPQAERPGFLREVSGALDSYFSLVRKTGNQPVGGRDGRTVAWQFANAQMVCLQEPADADEEETATILRLSGEYARGWWKTLRDVHRQLETLTLIATWFPQTNDIRPRRRSDGKIIVKSSAARMALLARIFFENDTFINTNKSEICRILCTCFGTTHQEDLSPITFKNHFDTPDPDAACLLAVELEQLLDTLRWVEKRYN